MKRIGKILIPLFVIGYVIAIFCGGPSSNDFEIKRNEAFLTENMGPVLVLNATLLEIAEHMNAAMKVVLGNDKLNALKAINLKYEVENSDNDHLRIATLHIPLAEWIVIPEKLRENDLWVACNLERWKKVIHYDLVMEVRKMKKKYDY